MKKYELKVYAGNDPRIEVTEDFVKKNNLRHVRSKAEIVLRLKGKMNNFSFEPEVLIEYLPYKEVREMLNEKAQKEYDKNPKKWKVITDVYETTQDFLDYMVFGWMKATDERGISSARTLEKLGVWAWLLGREDITHVLHDDDLFNPYGTPALIKVCEMLGIEVPEYVIEFSKKKR